MRCFGASNGEYAFEEADPVAMGRKGGQQYCAGRCLERCAPDNISFQKWPMHDGSVFR